VVHSVVGSEAALLSCMTGSFLVDWQEEFSLYLVDEVVACCQEDVEVYTELLSEVRDGVVVSMQP